MSETTALPPLSDRQRAVLDAIRSHVEDHGYPPSLREVAAIVGLESPSTVAYQVGQLVEKGYVRRDPNVPRALVLVDPGRIPCEACHGSGTVPAGAA